MPYSKLQDDTTAQPGSPNSETAPPIPAEEEKYGRFKPKVIRHCARMEITLAGVYFGIGILQAIFFHVVFAIQQWISAMGLILTAFFTWRSLKRRSKGNVKLVMIVSLLSTGLAVMCIAVAMGFLATFFNPETQRYSNHIINLVIFLAIIAVSVLATFISFIPATAACCLIRRKEPHQVGSPTTSVVT